MKKIIRNITPSIFGQTRPTSPTSVNNSNSTVESSFTAEASRHLLSPVSRNNSSAAPASNTASASQNLLLRKRLDKAGFENLGAYRNFSAAQIQEVDTALTALGSTTENSHATWTLIKNNCVSGNRSGFNAVLSLIRLGLVKPNMAEGNGDTLLHALAAEGQNCATTENEISLRDRVLMLKNAGAELKNSNAEGLHPLHVAARHGNAGALDSLLTAGADSATKDKAGFTALMHAAQENNLAALKTLIGANVAIDAHHSVTGDTALIIAIERGDDDVVAALVSAGASPTVWNRKGHEPVYLAARSNREKALQILMDSGKATTALTNRRALSEAVYEGHVEATKVLLEAGVNPHGSSNTLSPLTIAAKNNNTAIMALLFPKGVAINAVAPGPEGNTPLIYAARLGHEAATQLLIDVGTPLNDVNAKNHTALMQAASYGKVGTVRRLIDAGADLSHRETLFIGSTARHLAEKHEHHEAAALLLEAEKNALAQRNTRNETRNIAAADSERYNLL